MSLVDVESPCVRNCCLDQEDICLGCFRHIDEITSWTSLSNENKKAVLERCKSRQQGNLRPLFEKQIDSNN